jgi:hypothetical protein
MLKTPTSLGKFLAQNQETKPKSAPCFNPYPNANLISVY